MSDAPPAIRGQTYEEMTPGTRFRTARRTVTETDLVNFITLFGFNEPLFWDAGQAAAAGYEGRLCPGALTYCMAEGLVIQTHLIHGTGMAFVHMDLDVRSPVFVGDTVYAVVETNKAGTYTLVNEGSGKRASVTVRDGETSKTLLLPDNREFSGGDPYTVEVRLLEGETEHARKGVPVTTHPSDFAWAARQLQGPGDGEHM